MNNDKRSSYIYNKVTLKDVTSYYNKHNMSCLKGFTPKEISWHLFIENSNSQDKWEALKMLDKELYNKKRAKAYKEAFHKKYDHLTPWSKKLPNAKFNATFNAGIKACIKAKSELPYYEEFYNRYFTKYNVDSIIDYAYTLSEKEKDMCKTLLVASIQLYRDTADYKLKENNGGRVMDLSDIYIKIRTQKEVWSDDAKVINSLISDYQDQITNAVLPLSGNLASFGKLRDLQREFEDFNAKIEKNRFMRLVKKAQTELSHFHEPNQEDTSVERAVPSSPTIGDNAFAQNAQSCHNSSKVSDTNASLTNHQMIWTKEEKNEQDSTKRNHTEVKLGIQAREVHLNIATNTKERKVDSSKISKPRLKNDSKYSGQEEINQEVGDKGERIVLENEIRKTREWNLPKVLQEKVRRVSLESDDYGYDILSFDKEGNEHYIEVKTTKSSSKQLSFILTRNELEKAKKYGKMYSIVIVYDITKSPRIWYMGNPFSEEPYKVHIEPIKYMVSVNTETEK